MSGLVAALLVGREPFERRVRVGSLDTGHKRRAVVTAEIGWDGARLSISAVAGRPGARDIDAFGQMQDTIQAMPVDDLDVSEADRDALVWIWNLYHLNDMQPGCEHQTAAGWGRIPIVPGKPTDTYGLHYEGQTHASWNLLGWVRPEEYPDGLLTKPCLICGYRYGSAWLYRRVPTDALDRLRGIGGGDG